ncbi:hypothetical protein BSNK01_02390 [Bacillaceae bacterium]
MVTAVKLPDVKDYGPNEKNVLNLLNRLTNIDWFAACEKQRNQEEIRGAFAEFINRIGMQDRFELTWLTKRQLASFYTEKKLDESPIWPHLAPIPDKIKKEAEKAGRLAILDELTDRVPEMLFHGSYDGAFREFAKEGIQLVQTAVGAAMYLGGLACAWEVLADREGWQTNPFLPLVDVFERGHWPLGVYDGKFYVI